MSGLPAHKAAIHEAFLVFRHNMLSLQIALISGDLDTAREAFAALHGNALKSPPLADTSGVQAPAASGASCFVRLFQALRDGDIEHARSAFIGMQAALRSRPPTRQRPRSLGLSSFVAVPPTRPAWPYAGRFSAWN